MCSSRLWICEACEKPAHLLVHRLRREQPGHVRLQSFSMRIGLWSANSGMEGVVADPGLVPQHVVAEMADLLHAPCGRCRPCRRRSRAGCRPCGTGARPCGARGSLTQRMCCGSARAGYFSSHASQSTAPIMPNGLRAVGRKIGNRAGLDQRTLVQRLVVVAVEQHQVAAMQRRLGDDLVGRRGAVQDEVGPVGAEHAAPRGAAHRPPRRRESAGRRARRRHCTGRCGRSARRNA